MAVSVGEGAWMTFMTVTGMKVREKPGHDRPAAGGYEEMLSGKASGTGAAAERPKPSLRSDAKTAPPRNWRESRSRRNPSLADRGNQFPPEQRRRNSEKH